MPAAALVSNGDPFALASRDRAQHSQSQGHRDQARRRRDELCDDQLREKALRIRGSLFPKLHNGQFTHSAGPVKQLENQAGTPAVCQERPSGG